MKITNIDYEKLFNDSFDRYCRLGSREVEELLDDFYSRAIRIKKEITLTTNKEYTIKDLGRLFAVEMNQAIIDMMMSLSEAYIKKKISYKDIIDELKKADEFGSGELLVSPKIHERLLADGLIFKDDIDIYRVKGVGYMGVTTVASPTLDNHVILQPVVLNCGMLTAYPQFKMIGDEIKVEAMVVCIGGEYSENIKEQGLFRVFEIEN